MSHCANMQASNESDPEALTLAREEIRNFVGQWLGVTDSETSGQNSNHKTLFGLTILLPIALLTISKNYY